MRSQPVINVLGFLALVLLAVWLVRIETRQEATADQLCNGIHGYLIEQQGRSRERLGKIAYYKEHPDELEDALLEGDLAAARFMQLCLSLGSDMNHDP